MLSKFLAFMTFATLVAAEFPRGSFFIRNVKTGNVVTVRDGSIEVCSSYFDNMVITDYFSPFLLYLQAWSGHSAHRKY